MRALISNDDGVQSPGLKALADAAKKVGLEVYVVAPEREQSATAHSLTMDRPLRVRKITEKTWAVDGTPTDCVNLALCRILQESRPDFVLSGINAGPNLGDDVTYSGTVACALEGTLLGVPSIAFSLDTWQDDSRSEPDFAAAGEAALAVLRVALEQPPSGDTLWNVNIPPGPVKGFRATRMGRRRYGDSIVEKIDPRGKPYYWIGGRHVDTPADGTDLTAVADGFVSITPLHLDMTDYRALAALETLAGRLPEPKRAR
jgi:5'-nucleotidase